MVAVVPRMLGLHFGSPSELLDDWNTLGPEKTVELVASRYNGLKNLRSNFSEEEIGASPRSN